MYNFYDSVKLINGRENAFSLGEALYKAGDFLSKKSGLYQGKMYTVYLEDEQIRSAPRANLKKNYSLIEKVAAHAGACLKKIAAFFNGAIKTRHLLAKELEKNDRDQDAIDRLLASFKPEPVKTQGEGYRAARYNGGDCCTDCCNNCCPTDCLH